MNRRDRRAGAVAADGRGERIVAAGVAEGILRLSDVVASSKPGAPGRRGARGRSSRRGRARRRGFLILLLESRVALDGEQDALAFARGGRGDVAERGDARELAGRARVDARATPGMAHGDGDGGANLVHGSVRADRDLGAAACAGRRGDGTSETWRGEGGVEATTDSATSRDARRVSMSTTRTGQVLGPDAQGLVAHRSFVQ